MKLYALRRKSTGKFMTVRVTSNHPDAQFCNDTTVEFKEPYSMYCENIWTTTNKDQALLTSKSSVDWYNSSVEQPMNSFIDLEVVEFTLQN